MTNKELIVKLTELWYSCLVDHHKDRDCHFYINETYSYGREPKYSVEHYGYVAEEFTEEFNTKEAAEKYLISQLKKMIKEEAGWYLTQEPHDFPEVVGHEEHFKNILKELDNI